MHWTIIEPAGVLWTPEQGLVPAARAHLDALHRAGGLFWLTADPTVAPGLPAPGLWFRTCPVLSFAARLAAGEAPAAARVAVVEALLHESGFRGRLVWLAATFADDLLDRRLHTDATLRLLATGPAGLAARHVAEVQRFFADAAPPATAARPAAAWGANMGAAPIVRVTQLDDCTALLSCGHRLPNAERDSATLGQQRRCFSCQRTAVARPVA